MIDDLYSASEGTPIDVGLDLLLAHQHFVTDLVALGLATFMVTLVGSSGVSFMKLTVKLASSLRCNRRHGPFEMCRSHTVRVATNPTYHSNKGDKDGI